MTNLLRSSERWTPWCVCECHSNPTYKHLAACCCQHRIALDVDCPECCSLPRNSDGSCVEHNHHSQYNKAWGKEWVCEETEDVDDELLEEHVRKLLDEQDN